MRYACISLGPIYSFRELSLPLSVDLGIWYPPAYAGHTRIFNRKRSLRRPLSLTIIHAFLKSVPTIRFTSFRRIVFTLHEAAFNIICTGIRTFIRPPSFTR